MTGIIYLVDKTGPLEGTLGQSPIGGKLTHCDDAIAWCETLKVAQEIADGLTERQGWSESRNHHWYSFGTGSVPVMENAKEFFTEHDREVRASISRKLTQEEKALVGWRE